jgi:hypothetical protein
MWPMWHIAEGGLLHSHRCENLKSSYTVASKACQVADTKNEYVLLSGSWDTIDKQLIKF